MSAFYQLDRGSSHEHLTFAAELLNRQNHSMPTTAAFLKQAYGNGQFCCFLDKTGQPFGFARVQSQLPFLGPTTKQIRILVLEGHENQFTTGLFYDVLKTFDVVGHKNLIVEVREQIFADVVASCGFRVGTQKHTMRRQLTAAVLTTNEPLNPGIKVKAIRRPDELTLHEIYLCELGFIRDIPFALPITHQPTFNEFKKTFDGEGNVFFVAYNKQSHMLGYSCLMTNDPEKMANFASTAVLKAYRSMGVALAIKVTALKWCWNEGLINVTSQNHATNHKIIALNRRLGFEISHTRFEMVPC